jgi:hypothetical protein
MPPMKMQEGVLGSYLLAAYHVQEFGKSPNKGDNDRIIEWLKKAVARDLELEP